ncbi:XRE family transcriptional regulator [Halomonas sp. SSL-5]|uniref:XRE family transcriptional regulator n=1 Tax=Halomonas sp. SSL-5 TaxID=3065855 RepID=UPI0039E0A17E
MRKHGIERFRERLAVALGDEKPRAFAQRSDFSEGSIRSYLSGDTYPALDRLLRLASDLGVDPSWLATGHAERTHFFQESRDASDSHEEPDDFAYIEGMTTTSEGVGRTLYAVRRDWLKSRGLEPTHLRFLVTREDDMAPTIKPGDRLLCETLMHRADNGSTIGLAPDELPSAGGIYLLRIGDKGPTTLRRLRLDMGGGLVLSADADESLHLHIRDKDQLRRTHILARAVALWRDL